MKKVIVWGLIGLLAVPAVLAQRVPEELKPETIYEITGQRCTPYEEVMERIQNRQRLGVGDVPRGYDWCGGDTYQLDKNVFYTAKAVYEKHPHSFNAVYNYGLLIYYKVATEIGLVATDQQLDAAYAVFEEAKKINPKEEDVYHHQIIILQEKILRLAEYMEEPGGFAWDKFSRAVIREEQNHWLARKLLDNITAVFKLQGVITDKGTIKEDASVKPYLLFNAWSAYEICQALNRTEAAAAWKALAQRWDQEYEKQVKEDEKRAALQSKELERSLKKTFIKTAYLKGLEQLQRNLK